MTVIIRSRCWRQRLFHVFLPLVLIYTILSTTSQWMKVAIQDYNMNPSRDAPWEWIPLLSDQPQHHHQQQQPVPFSPTTSNSTNENPKFGAASSVLRLPETTDEMTTTIKDASIRASLSKTSFKPSIQPQTFQNENDNEKNHINTMSNTVILGFTDKNYVDIAQQWYRNLQDLGYHEHYIVAHDKDALQILQAQQGMRSIDLTPHSNHSLRQDCESLYQRVGNKKQYYRRSLFGSRWHYILKLLEQGKHVLLSDIDSLWLSRRNLKEELEDSDVDVFHAYGGTVPSFPLLQFQVQGFTLCGCLSWWRSTPKVLKFVRALVNECKCRRLHCRCQCDDQRVLNKLVAPGGDYEIEWDSDPDDFEGHSNVTEWTREGLSWEGRRGTCRNTGHRVAIWDRNVAYRDQLPPTKCPPNDQAWTVLPETTQRGKIAQVWQEYCPV